jgi:hypothetical protein
MDEIKVKGMTLAKPAPPLAGYAVGECPPI